MRLRRLRQQVERVGLLDVLAEHEHARAGMVGADLARGAQALVGVRRRHAHVDHGHVGLVGADLAQQVLGVAGLAGDLEARVLEQAHEALAQAARSPRRRRPSVGYLLCSYGDLRSESSARPGWRVECQGSIQCADAVGEAAQTRPTAGIRAADTIVAHFDLRRGRSPAGRPPWRRWRSRTWPRWSAPRRSRSRRRPRPARAGARPGPRRP